MTLNPVVIGGAYSPSFLRSPYAETRKRLNRCIHAGALNRSENQSTRFWAPENRYERANPARQAADSTRASYEELTRRAAS